MKGKFITFEGSEGCGKSTQSRLLYEYLRKQGYAVIYLREPGSTKFSEKIRAVLLDKKNNFITPISEMLLYMAARAQVVEEIIKPALSLGEIVICDRFLDSTLAYQGFGLGMDLEAISYIGKFVTGGINPDLTILLDLPVKKGFKYHKLDKDRIEQRSVAYHLRVRKGYFKLARLQPQRIKILKADSDKVQIQKEIRSLVDKFLKRKLTTDVI